MLNKLAKQIHKIAVDHGFWDEPRNDGEMIALMHSELSEALEAIRVDDPDEPVEVELADCIIRILDFCYARGLDIEKAIAHKMEKNRNRPHMHGKKF